MHARPDPNPGARGRGVLIHNHVWHRSGVNVTGKTAAGDHGLLHERGDEVPAEEAGAEGVREGVLRGHAAAEPRCRSTSRQALRTYGPSPQYTANRPPISTTSGFDAYTCPISPIATLSPMHCPRTLARSPSFFLFASICRISIRPVASGKSRPHVLSISAMTRVTSGSCSVERLFSSERRLAHS